MLGDRHITKSNAPRTDPSLLPRKSELSNLTERLSNFRSYVTFHTSPSCVVCELRRVFPFIVGYCRTRAFPYHNLVLLSWCPWDLRCLRCDRYGLIQQREAMAARDRPIRHRGCQQTSCRQQERYGRQEGCGIHSCKGE